MASLPAVEPLAHSPEGAAKRLGVPLRLIYSLIAAGELQSAKLGRRRLIPDTELQRLLQRKLREVS